MGGVLILLGLIALVLWVFVRLFRARVQSRLRAAGHALPEELRPPVPVRAAGVPAARPAAAGATAAVVAPPVVAPGAGASARLAAGGLHFMLIYDVAADFVQRRAQHRDEHLALAWKSAAAGELLLAGALEESAGQAFLLFRGSREAAARFARADPYVREGLVKEWRVRQWHTVVGEAAALPVRPRSGPAASA